jgi:diacylglycerol kinase family enzyme
MANDYELNIMADDKKGFQHSAILNALKLKYESEIAIAKTNIDVYLVNSVGVGQHPTIVEAVELELKKVDNAQSMLDVIQKHYS